MKKLLISLLLISLITMVGVFADDPHATLTLQTSIDAVTRIGITESAEVEYGDDNNAVVVEELFGDAGFSTATTIAYLHYETNDQVGMKVTMTATELAHGALEATYIPYTLTSFKDDETLTGTITAAGGEGSSLSGIIFTKAANVGLVTETQELKLLIPGNADDYPAGKYEATITFTLEAQ